MCLITFAWQSHPKYELVLVANRDEFFKRPTIPMHFWENAPNILAGKDLQSGGTWLGANTNGRFTALTNYRDGLQEKQNTPSRGFLTGNFLENQQYAQDYVRDLENVKQNYNGFNLLTLDDSGFYYLSNYYPEIQRIKEGIYGLSNSILNDFSWQKTNKAVTNLTQIIEKENLTTDKLINLLVDTELAPDEKLPNTGIPYKWEKGLSSMFISHFPEYGTRCSTVVLKDYQGNFNLQEITYDANQHIVSDVKYTLHNES